MPTNWAEVRSEFPALNGITYLNTATYGQMPRAGVAAVQQHFTRRDALACTDFLSWFDDADQLRSQIAELINAGSGSDIAFAPTASAACSWLLNGLDWRNDDTIVTLAGEFPNNLYAPATLESRGVRVVETDWDGMQRIVDSGGVRLVMLSSANYATGFMPNLSGFGDAVRRAGGLLFVDGTQSVGALPLDVQDVRPDMLAVNAYKWMISPNGAGFAYLSPQLRSQLRPSVVGWRSDRGWRNVDELQHGSPTFPEGAEAYEGGMLNFPSLSGLQAAVSLMLRLGVHEIGSRVLELAAQCRDAIQRLGGSIAHPTSPILAASFPGFDASTLARELQKERIFVSARHGRLRVSVHLYNHPNDIAVLEACLARLLA